MGGMPEFYDFSSNLVIQIKNKKCKIIWFYKKKQPKDFNSTQKMAAAKKAQAKMLTFIVAWKKF